MQNFKIISRMSFVFTVLLAALVILSGCAATINYTYDPTASFAGLKTYNWAMTGTVWQNNDLVLKNIQYDADQVLMKKGFTKTTEKPDILIAATCESEYGVNRYGYEIRILTLHIQKADSKQMIWPGSATGTTNTDAASGDLKKAVEGILANFPPKK